MHAVADRPKLTQVQIIQSLAEALSWFEKEINWGISPGFDGILSLKIQFITCISTYGGILIPLTSTTAKHDGLK